MEYTTRPMTAAPKTIHGSGIFFHISTGRPTLGCVSLPLPRLVAAVHGRFPRDSMPHRRDLWPFVRGAIFAVLSVLLSYRSLWFKFVEATTRPPWPSTQAAPSSEPR